MQTAIANRAYVLIIPGDVSLLEAGNSSRELSFASSKQPFVLRRRDRWCKVLTTGKGHDPGGSGCAAHAELID